MGIVNENENNNFCSNCGSKLDANSKFCHNCGHAVKEYSTEAQSENNNKRVTVYDGNIHKCPNCGEVLKAFTTNCPTCGYEIRGVETTCSLREFTKKLEQLEDEQGNKKNKVGLGNAIFGNGVSRMDERKINLIKNFTIPNTKEDIFEFIILSSSSIDYNVYGYKYNGFRESQRAVSDAWRGKMEQAYRKAQISFGTSSEFNNIKEIYENSIKKYKKKKWETPIILTISFGILVLLFVGILIGLASSSKYSKNNSTKEKNILEQSTNEVQIDNSSVD